MVISRYAAPEKAPKDRKFGGEIYRRGICFSKKDEAEMSAQTQRKEGYKVRIVNYGRYCLYYRPSYETKRRSI